MILALAEMRDFLNEKAEEFNDPTFIEQDPIRIPHQYSLKEDIEIAGFLAATIAWGRRSMIMKNAHKMMDLMGNSPYDFVMTHSNQQLKRLDSFVHRTFNGTDFKYFVKALQNIYQHHDGLEGVFVKYQTEDSLQPAIAELHRIFFELEHEKRSEKHVANPRKGSVAKRINLFLRWMVRNDGIVDFGLWPKIRPAKLSCPLDVHSGNIARKLGLITQKNNTKKALKELDDQLRILDPKDPVKYDFALFGLGESKQL